jgi:transcriptional regulator with XRE-family HTH domain
MRPPNRIDELARGSRMTALQVAQHCGVTERTVHRWKRNQVDIPAEQVHRLADLFGVSEPWLLGLEDGDGNGNGGQQVAA